MKTTEQEIYEEYIRLLSLGAEKSEPRVSNRPSSGESKWEPSPLSSKVDVGEGEWVREDEPTQIDEEKPKYTDEEYFKMVKQDPVHVVTNLRLQRQPPYNQFVYVYPLVKSLINWLSELNMSPQKGTLLYDEAQYMLDIVEKEAKHRESKK